MSEARLLRDRHQAAEDRISRSQSPTPDGARSLLVTTTVDTTYPTTAGAFYACFVTEVSGPETEGSAPTFTQQTQIIHVLNLGTVVPPEGTSMLAESQGGIFVSRYDG